jgi:intracellular septation protein A
VPDTSNPFVPTQSVSVRSVLLTSGPRFARDAFGPLLAFYVAWKTAGVVVGILVATVFATLAWVYERRHGRPGMVARLSLGLVVIHAVIGLATHSATIYLAQPLLLSGALGLTFTVSTFVRRPLAGIFAVEMFPFSPEMRSSEEYRRVFGRVSLAWGAYLLVHCGVLLVVLLWWGVDVFVVVNIATSAPMMTGLLAWSIWYTVATFRRSDDWGWVLRGESSRGGVATPDGPVTS